MGYPIDLIWSASRNNYASNLDRSYGQIFRASTETLEYRRQPAQNTLHKENVLHSHAAASDRIAEHDMMRMDETLA